MCLLYIGIQLILEIHQIYREKTYYFTSVGSIWNFIDITSSLLSLAFICMTLGGLDETEGLFIVGGLSVFCLWLKLFYFMRMFKATAAFVRIIVEMFIDIRIFLFIFFVGVFAFSNAFFIFDKYMEIQN